MALSGPQAGGQCHVRVLIADLRLDFRATLTQAQNFAAALSKWSSGLRVFIDDELRPDLPVLPCARLWNHPRFEY